MLGSGGQRAPVLVVEDAPAGVRAGRAAGCAVLALATTHPVDGLRDAGADWVVRDLGCVRLAGVGEDGWRVVMEEVWVEGK